MDNQASVRMYNVRIRRLFPIVDPYDDGERRILVDCGYHSQGKGEFSDKEISCKSRRTSRDRASTWWLPPIATKTTSRGFGEQDLWTVWRRRSLVAVHRRPRGDKGRAGPPGMARTPWAPSAMWDANGIWVLRQSQRWLTRCKTRRQGVHAMEPRANEPGIENLFNGFKKPTVAQRPWRFLPRRGDYPTSFITPVLPGITTHVLGPPTDPAMRRSKKVPSTWAFDSAIPGLNAISIRRSRPEWHAPKERLPTDRPSRNDPPVDRLFNDDLLFAAKALDGFLNGESLVSSSRSEAHDCDR